MAGGKELTVITFRGIFQEVEEARGMYSDGYRDQSAVVALDGGDMKEMGVEAGHPVHLETASGDVVVAAKLSEEAHPGVAFMPASPWSAQLLSGEVGEDGFLELKMFTVRASSGGGRVTSIEEIEAVIRAP
ncbi:molybdopterin dinucleotide binding domain-containing protein [Candidatus Methanocrinis natronophilus]|uniref:Molybdopterin dinucleotide binding domain-containing protein n=1 Tax=Candidatus Methanocrinis natronophilus TaxID=3033396 RepID=A0ABT5X9E6_9EURY|nr:molybdopterin dinucleotide binding domain-containing protein [Candidatus Methanocrinis natronophilus]MDF0591331.1 molybdopterin dinucleotide binding domain-containing protein [Candidatus Methanocrinis natronophilus]